MRVIRVDQLSIPTRRRIAVSAKSVRHRLLVRCSKEEDIRVNFRSLPVTDVTRGRDHYWKCLGELSIAFITYILFDFEKHPGTVS